MFIRPRFSFAIGLLALIAVASLAFDPDTALAAGGDPFGSIADKGTDLRDNLIMIGNVIVGVVVAVLGILAVFGRVNWYWVMTAIAGGAILNGVTALQDWITS